MKINITNFRISKDKIVWLNKLFEEFAEEHDMIINTKVREWGRSREGISYFIEWLRNTRGWQVRYWELPPVNHKDSEPMYVGYGLDIDDACPKFIEAKLKSE